MFISSHRPTRQPPVAASLTQILPSALNGTTIGNAKLTLLPTLGSTTSSSLAPPASPPRAAPSPCPCRREQTASTVTSASRDPPGCSANFRSFAFTSTEQPFPERFASVCRSGVGHRRPRRAHQVVDSTSLACFAFGASATLRHCKPRWRLPLTPEITCSPGIFHCYMDLPERRPAASLQLFLADESVQALRSLQLELRHLRVEVVALLDNLFNRVVPVRVHPDVVAEVADGTARGTHKRGIDGRLRRSRLPSAGRPDR